ncbi:MAG: hypothetical protein ABFC56_08670 [Clostridiaceae bacterium]
MAERRMFAKTIIDSDAFTEMPLSTQALYFHLSMRADDEGFLNCAQKIMRMIGAAKNDYDVLLAKRFVVQFDDGICVIKHWRIHNYIQKDRFKPTIYQEERSALSIKTNGSYTLKNTMDTECIQGGYALESQVRLGEDSLGKDRIEIEDAGKPRRFIKPTVEEIAEYCKERGNRIKAQAFFDWNESKGWKVGNSPMKDWKAAIRTWEQRDKEKNPPQKEVNNADRYAITEGFKTSF